MARFYDTRQVLNGGQVKSDDWNAEIAASLSEINGTNRMLKWWGRESVSNFGFVSPTPSPGIADILTNYIAYEDSVGGVPPTFYIRLTNGQTCIRLASSDDYGLGDPEVGDVNRYDYKISFISDTGSESPLSLP